MRTLVLVILVGLAPASYADPPRYTRKPDLKLDVKPSARVRPIRPATARRGPDVTPDDVLEHQRLAEPMRREQEAILIGLIADTPDSDPDKPDYFFRLAEHYAEQLRYWHLKSVELTIGD
jgi:hypothetical protein